MLRNQLIWIKLIKSLVLLIKTKRKIMHYLKKYQNRKKD